MKIVKNLPDWQLVRETLHHTPARGFVPTMGALHAGHASLIDRSQRETEVTIVSIFVNPTQFNNTNDFNQYPRLVEKDITLLEKLGVDYLFLPSPADIYPFG